MTSVLPALLFGLAVTPSADAQGLSPYPSAQGQSCGLDCFISWLGDMGSVVSDIGVSGGDALGTVTDLLDDTESWLNLTDCVLGH